MSTSLIFGDNMSDDDIVMVPLTRREIQILKIVLWFAKDDEIQVDKMPVPLIDLVKLYYRLP